MTAPTLTKRIGSEASGAGGEAGATVARRKLSRTAGAVRRIRPVARAARRVAGGRATGGATKGPIGALSDTTPAIKAWLALVGGAARVALILARAVARQTRRVAGRASATPNGRVASVARRSVATAFAVGVGSVGRRGEIEELARRASLHTGRSAQAGAWCAVSGGPRGTGKPAVGCERSSAHGAPPVARRALCPVAKLPRWAGRDARAGSRLAGIGGRVQKRRDPGWAATR